YAKMIDKQVFPGVQGGPLMHIIAAKATSFKEALSDDFKTYAKQIIANTQALGEGLANGGIRLVSGGSDNHLLLLDIAKLRIKGKVSEEVLDNIGISMNKNVKPFDIEDPFDTRCVHVGTTSVIIRGFKEAEMQEISDVIVLTLNNLEDEAHIQEASERVGA